MATAVVTVKVSPSELQVINRALLAYYELCSNVYLKRSDKLANVELRPEHVNDGGRRILQVLKGFGMT